VLPYDTEWDKMKRQKITVAVNSWYKRHIQSQRTMTGQESSKEVLRFGEELVSLVLHVTQSNTGQTARYL